MTSSMHRRSQPWRAAGEGGEKARDGERGALKESETLPQSQISGRSSRNPTPWILTGRRAVTLGQGDRNKYEL